ncbi:hypothetical protein FR483_n208L [Paramecium bursaria Chlorella virus FR483]|uniref:Uncharacterized protein n208L n=1 Tax=Paramecium bursaria Chlorella virus FR483 TaxID=399781 RepID=A7J6R2_PBCVF|nr:hypothetical protein FR483_n208L [Paramecium bursaria Chlorella virus FR483]ABT15493.1 hypothetical protein FR483_n208L [Paramecium bursaria Chlorella virus FR483]
MTCLKEVENIAEVNDSAATWCASSNISVPKPSKESYFRLRSVWIIHMTKSPEVSQTGPRILETVAFGTKRLMLSSNCSAKNSL